MGAFFTNVQVYTHSRLPEDLRSTIVTALRRFVPSDTFMEVSPDDPTAERMLVVGPAGPEPWIVVYDSATEGQDEAQLDALAGALSTAAEGTAVSVLIHDSDVLEMRLWRSGDLLDAYSSCPDYFGPVSRERQVLLAGQPDRWRDLLIDGVSPADLRRVWDESLLFAEATLAQTAQLLGMDPNRCGTGLRYLLHDGADEITAALDAAGFIRLAFRSAQTPAAVAPPEPPSGPPVLTIESGSTGVDTSIGESLTWATCAAGNAGGPGRGLQVVVWGNALDQGLIALDALAISLPPDDAAASATWITCEPQAIGSGDSMVRVVRLDDYPLLGDTAGWGDAFIEGSWQNPHAAIAARMHRRISVQLHGTAQAVGQGQLHVGFVPLANPHNGQTSWTFAVNVARRARRPLRYAVDSPGADRSLRDLDQPRVLVALMALGTDRSTSVRVAADAIDAWNRVIASQIMGCYEGFIHERFDYRPRAFHLATRDIPDRLAWQELRSAMETCVSLHGSIRTAGADDTGDPADFTSGFLFEVDGLSFQLGHDTAAPQLVLWWDTAGHGDVVIGQQVGCSRWLRAATERIWLGPQLLARLPDRDALERICELTPIGDGMRVVLRPTATLDDLEHTLAPILPGPSDWVRGMDLLYGHRQPLDVDDADMP